MTAVQAFLLGLLQGATELVPISSLGHAVLLPSVLHWRYRPGDPSFVPFLVLLHLGTAAALLVIYRATWARIAVAMVRAVRRGSIEGPDERLAALLALGTLPAGALGLFLEQPLKALFGNPRAVAVFLVVNGLGLLGTELLRRRSERIRGADRISGERREDAFGDAESLTYRQALLVGTTQALALFPGISRSGVTIAGGLISGLSHGEAARFSFLLATPIIAAAGLLEVPQIVGTGASLGTYALGGIAALVAAYLSATVLVRYFRSGRLDPFGYYCVAAGLGCLIWLR